MALRGFRIFRVLGFRVWRFKGGLKFWVLVSWLRVLGVGGTGLVPS